MSRPRHMLRVIKGGFAPADNYTADALRARGYRIGDIVAADITKPRNPAFNRLAHALGRLAAENLDAFHGLQAHDVLKRLQLESGIGCELIRIKVKGIGYTDVKQAKSLSFQSMDEADFRDVFRAMCRHLAAEYWEGLDEDKVAEMAELMSNE